MNAENLEASEGLVGAAYVRQGAQGRRAHELRLRRLLEQVGQPLTRSGRGRGTGGPAHNSGSGRTPRRWCLRHVTLKAAGGGCPSWQAAVGVLELGVGDRVRVPAVPQVLAWRPSAVRVLPQNLLLRVGVRLTGRRGERRELLWVLVGGEEGRKERYK